MKSLTLRFSREYFIHHLIKVKLINRQWDDAVVSEAGFDNSRQMFTIRFHTDDPEGLIKGDEETVLIS